MERIANDVTAFGGGVRGSVSICASASAIAEALLDDLSSFMREPANQNIRVDVEERLSLELVRHLREGAASVGVCWDSVGLEWLQHRPYRQDRLALAVHSMHPLARRKSLSFEETLEHEDVGLLSFQLRSTRCCSAQRAARKPLHAAGIATQIACGGEPYGSGLGKSQWVVECTSAWLRSTSGVCASGRTRCSHTRDIHRKSLLATSEHLLATASNLMLLALLSQETDRRPSA